MLGEIITETFIKWFIILNENTCDKFLSVLNLIFLLNCDAFRRKFQRFYFIYKDEWA